MKSPQIPNNVTKEKKWLIGFILSTLLTLILVLLGQIFIDNKFIGTLMRVTMLILPLLAIFKDRKLLERTAALSICLYYIVVAGTFITQTHLHPFAFLLVFISYILYVLGSFQIAKASESSRNMRLLAPLILCISIIVLLVSSFFNLPNLRIVVSIVAIASVCYNIYKYQQGIGFVLLGHLLTLIVVYFFERA